MIERLMQAVEAGLCSASDVGVWSYLSWRSNRLGLYTESRGVTASRLGITVEELKGSVRRLQKAGVLLNKTKRGSRAVCWALLPKYKGKAGPTTQNAGKPDTQEMHGVSGLPF